MLQLENRKLVQPLHRRRAAAAERAQSDSHLLHEFISSRAGDL